MKVEYFKSLLNQCKHSLRRVGHLNLKCKTWDNHKAWFIVSSEEQKCKTCGHITQSNSEGVYLYFKKPKDYLTIFEADLIYMMFVLKIIPLDYAGWHECQSGKDFIENIDSIQYMEKLII